MFLRDEALAIAKEGKAKTDEVTMKVNQDLARADVEMAQYLISMKKVVT